MAKAVMVLFGVLLAALSQAEVKTGELSPSYLGKNRAGEDVQVGANRDNVIVATFWSTKCESCLREMEVLEGVQRKINKNKLEVIAINYKQGAKTFKKIKKKLSKYTMTVTHDRYGKVGKEFGVESLPHTVIIDKSGIVRHIHQGYDDAMIIGVLKEIEVLL